MELQHAVCSRLCCWFLIQFVDQLQALPHLSMKPQNKKGEQLPKPISKPNKPTNLRLPRGWERKGKYMQRKVDEKCCGNQWRSGDSVVQRMLKQKTKNYKHFPYISCLRGSNGRYNCYRCRLLMKEYLDIFSHFSDITLVWWWWGKIVWEAALKTIVN